jgi:hypothetical protein
MQWSGSEIRASRVYAIAEEVAPLTEMGFERIKNGLFGRVVD